MKKYTSAIIWIIAVIALLAAAYTIYAKYSPKSAAPDSASQETKEKVKAPDFTLKDLDGNTVKLSDYKGKIVILNFWAVWCKFCVQEMPDLNELNAELKKDDKAVILAVDVEESADTIKDYLTSNNISLNVLLDQDGAVARTYGISGLPNTFVIDREGYVNAYIPGATDKKTLEEIIQKIS